MVECATEELVALHLAATDAPDLSTATVAPPERAVAGIGEVLDVDDGRMAGRIELLSAIAELKREGLVTEHVTRVVGFEDERNVYALTEAGESFAARVRDRVADERIRVHEGDDVTEVPLRDVDRFLPDPALPRALARLSDGDLYLDPEVGEPFVNRTAELATLESRLEDAADGRQRSVLVAGEAGIGKTTLVTELLDLARERGFRVRTGVCRRDADEPYHPFRSVLAENPARSPFDEGGDAVETERELAAQRRKLFARVTAAVEDLAADRPTVAFVDDLHVASEDTVALFSHLASHVDGPVLLVGTYRPEDLPEDHPLASLSAAWRGEDSRHAHCPLDRFGVEETTGLIEWIVGTRRVPGAFVETVQDRTGGNPLFVAESVRQMLEADAVDPARDRYPEAGDWVPIPDAVEDTIDVRLEVLDSVSRDVLDHAAVAGETFATDLLVAAVDRPEPQVRERVDLLVDSDVFERVDAGTLRFTSGLVRETVVDRLSADRHTALHARVGAALDDAPDVERHAARIARHYREAGEVDRALEHYLAAADRAEAVYAHDAAIDACEDALELARDLGRDDAVRDLLERLGRTYFVLGEYAAADRHFEYVRERADDPATLRRIARRQTQVARQRGAYEDAISHAERGLDVTGDPVDSPDGCRLLCHLGWARMQRGAFDEAAEDFARAESTARDLDDPELLGLALHNHGTLELVRANFDDDDTVGLFEQAIDAREAAGDRYGLAETYNNLGATHIRRKEPDRAAEALERSREINAAIGDEGGVATALNNLGRVYHEHHGDYDRARECYEEARERSRAIDARQTHANALTNLGELEYDLGDDPGAALDDLERGLERQRELGNTRWQVSTIRTLVAVHCDRGEFDAALDRGEAGLDLATDHGLDEEAGLIEHGLGLAYDATGEFETAVDRFESALDRARSFEDADHEAQRRLGLADVLPHLDRLDEAADHARRARDLASGTADADRIATRADLALARVDCLRGDLASARDRLRDLDGGIDDDETRAVFRLERGQVRRRQGDHDGATEDFDRARELAERVGSAVVLRWVERVADGD